MKNAHRKRHAVVWAALILLISGLPGSLVVAESPAGEANRERPRFDERADERRRMVEMHIRPEIDDNRVLAAMRHVPRHLFVPPRLRGDAYANRPLPIGQGQTISQPYIVAAMTEALKLKPDDKVLEIGTGSGYQAAVLSELTPRVYSIEILESLGNEARERFQQLGYDTIETRIADGYYGWEEHAPFDAIIVTAAAGHLPPPLIAQLAPGGRMIAPVGGPYEVQRLILVTKDQDGEVRHEFLMPVRFVPMTGRAQE
ncbi:protein-L-isoaspartate(D-aspartate) O-methyltransferase [bacterium]|nr:protein-L-isoaspartate(D-aspartate) O-methyltransferase [bacterium]